MTISASLILGTLYKLLIGPLELFFEVLFTLAYKLVADAGLSIIFLSLAMNFLVLPLYRRADALQMEERDRSAAMKHWVTHIKKTFKGDERFMMLQTYYRQVGYKQTDALKGSISLLLEIPFFIAAFHFLSNLELLRGVSFGPITDLGSPDALLVIGGVTLNALPILMTLINVISAAIYMKGFPISSKIQMYGIAAIFLVLLYNSPAGLVFYWTLNNLFSLVKNLFYKMRNPKKVLVWLASITGAVLFVAAFAAAGVLPSPALQPLMIACAIALQIPLVAQLLGKRFSGKFSIREATRADGITFMFGCLLLALITGLFIPLTVIASSPAEFVDLQAVESPLWFLLDSTALALGLFVIWFGVFYRLATPKGKTIFGYVLLVAVGAALIDYLLFGTSYGTLSNLLRFDRPLVVTPEGIAANIAAIVGAALVLLLVWRKGRALVRVAYVSLCIGLVAMSISEASGIDGKIAEAQAAVERARYDAPHFTLSTEGQNVVVIMMDRAISYYLPYLINEDPQLAEQLQGFTFYPNTVSFGAYTNVGVPPIYGGYEYTPTAMNERREQTLGEKQDEALKIMPVLFNEAGFDTTVFDPTYAGYNWIPDLSIYDEYPGIQSYITMDGSFRYDEYGQTDSGDTGPTREQRSRNFFCYGLFKTAPLAVHQVLYDKGNYNAADTLVPKSETKAVKFVSPQVTDGLSKARGVEYNFMRAYGVLDSLPDITIVSDEAQGGFLMMSNDTTHEPMILQEPEYIPAPTVDNTAFDAEHQGRSDAQGNYIDFSNDAAGDKLARGVHYQINMAAFKELGAWFDHLRENGVWDNTRIIIVSDHAAALWLRPEQVIETNISRNEKQSWDPLMFNCMLMVKDFDSQEFTVDTTFMTNADTPTLAMEGLIESPTNPFTGNPISSDAKAGDQHLLWSWDWDISENDGNRFLPGYWFTVHDDVFDANNWKYVGYR